MKKYLTLLLCVGLVTFYSCGDDDMETCETSNLTYTNDIAPIINASCGSAACHGSDTMTSFPMGNYEEASFAVTFGRIVGAINHEEGFLPMPYPEGAAKLDQCNIDKITAWINDGAPE